MDYESASALIEEIAKPLRDLCEVLGEIAGILEDVDKTLRVLADRTGKD